MIFLKMELHIDVFWFLAVVDFSEVSALIPEDEPVKSLELFPGDCFARSAGVSTDVLKMSFLVVIKDELRNIEI